MLLGCMIMLVSVSAQNNEKIGSESKAKHPNFEEVQLKQVLKSLMLDDKTQAKFIPVYQKYQKDMKACCKPQVKKKNAEMTDAEIANEIEHQFKQGRKIIDVKEKYYKEFKKILTMKQIQKIYRLERMNMRHIGKEMNRRQGMKRPPISPNGVRNAERTSGTK